MVRSNAARQAVQEADALLHDLNVDQTAPVDVFNIVNQLGLWLVFNPLKTLLGAAVPAGDGGIMVTTERGPAVQRFTAAHEVGHWILDFGGPAFDTEDDIYRPGTEREVLAQIFASHLLMPPPLIYATCSHYGIEGPSSVPADAVYRIARDIGASYEAVVRRLGDLEIVTPARRDELLRIKPATIKAELCRGHRPTGSVDVWPMGLDSSGSQIAITEGDEIVVLLPENRTTGHRWLTADDLARRNQRAIGSPPIVESSGDLSTGPSEASARRAAPRNPTGAALARIPGNRGAIRILPPTETLPSLAPKGTRNLAVVDDRYLASHSTLPASQIRAARRAIAQRRNAFDEPVNVGGTGTRMLALQSVHDGQSAFEVVYSSAFNPDAEAIETYRLDVDVRPKPSTLSRRGYLSVDLDDVDDLPPRDLDEPGEQEGGPHFG